MRYLGPIALVAFVAACGTSGGVASPSSGGPSQPSGQPTSPSATAPASLSPSPGASGSPAAGAGRIAYVIGPEGARELHVVKPDGSGDLSCGTGSTPSWSADGQTLVFAGPTSPNADEIEFPDVYRAAADCTDVAMLIKEGISPHLSPDGAQITFGRGVIDTGDAWIAKADGSEPRNLMTGTSPTWSPDGEWLLLNPDTGAYELGLIRPDGTAYNVLTRGYDPSWTPDGRIIYGHSDYPTTTTNTLRVIALDGTAIDLFATTGDLGSPRMLESGRVIFVLNGDVWRLDPGSAEPVQLTQGIQAASSPSVSPDGKQIAVAAGGSLPGLAVVSLDGGSVTVLPGMVSDVAWQPVAGGSQAPMPAIVLRPAPANMSCDAIGVEYHSVTFHIDPEAAEQVSATTDTGQTLLTYWAAGFAPDPLPGRVIRDPAGNMVVADGDVLVVPQGAGPRVSGHFVCLGPNALWVLLEDPS